MDGQSRGQQQDHQPSGQGKRAVPSRRQFLYSMAAAGATATSLSHWATAYAQDIQPLVVDNPLGQYPNRDWEKVYRGGRRRKGQATRLQRGYSWEL